MATGSRPDPVPSRLAGRASSPSSRRRADARALRALRCRALGAGAGILCAALAAERAAQELLARADAGRVTERVVDGDTLITDDGTRWRIYGIDAPERGQWCLRAADGRRWPCGRRAARALRRYAPAGQPIDCRRLDRDRHGRSVGVCVAGGEDVARRLVADGLAVEFRRYSDGRYAAAETRARHASAGVHGGCFTPPFEWRRGDRRCGRD